MRLVKTKDNQGWLHNFWVFGDAPDTEAEQGIPHDPPDFTQLDWQGEICKELHNLLINRNLITWDDVLKDGAKGLDNAIRGIILPKLKAHYKLEE